MNGRTVEIEQELSYQDATLLWQVCTAKLTKTRHVFPSPLGQKWEVDIFYHKEEIYLVMAEIEFSEEEACPELPLFLKKHVIYEVGLTDNRFSNTKLGDVEYTKALYRKLLVECQHG